MGFHGLLQGRLHHQGIFTGTRGRGSVRRYKCRWEDNTEEYLKGMGYMGVDWISLAPNRAK
jgi:hypothetical protein